jgi:hypothetical protein
VTESLRQILTDGLEAKVKRQYDRLLDAMLRELSYLESTVAPVLSRATSQGWTTERIQTVLAINAFHRIIIGPLEAAFGVELRTGLGRAIPIVYGQTLRIDAEEGAATRRALAVYHRLLEKRGLDPSWLSMTRVSDVLFSMRGDEEWQLE